MYQNVRKKQDSSLIQIDGMKDLLLHYAKCCHPIPGDPITGFISRGRGLIIHQTSCPKSFEIDPREKSQCGMDEQI